MKGVVFTPNEKMYTKDFGQPLYMSIGEEVGGWIEVVHPRGLEYPLCFVANEEGLLRGLPVNPIGSLWYGTLEHGHPIVGTIVVMKEGETEDGPDIAGLSDKEIAELKQLAKELSGGLIIDADIQNGG